MISALIPVKNLSASKSRLAKVLSPEQREKLSIFMLKRVLQVLQEGGRFNLVCLVTKDMQAAEIGRNYGAEVIWESDLTDENLALEYATEVCRSRGVKTLLVLPADIPFLHDQDLESMLQDKARQPKVAICPSKEGMGTNALLRTPPDAIPVRFGPNSFSLHLREAREKEIPCEVYHLPRVAFDIDTPEDLLTLKNEKEYSQDIREFLQGIFIEN
jgi:2-phospho-L-lactate guanylyltransferase